MGYIKIERKKLASTVALLIVVVGGLSSFATHELVRERTSSRISLAAIDRNFDAARCESVVLDTQQK